MKEVVLSIENLSKKYRLGEIGTGTLSHDLNRFWHKIRGKEDPYSQIGQENDRTKKATSDYVDVLKDISFEVKQGEVVGIIGANGAGKSTLLKLVSRITSPSSGKILAKGRIASLLEVGTGMHPEMTARENIYLNGSILGMTKKEITRKFDEIIDFAGCALYIDTPVKRFSSGMRVRLGFAVAAFLEPEILIVDEVLAVGDVEFQRKAIGKMQEVSSNEGRTILFVSHNMGAVKMLCTRGIVLNKGQVYFDGTPDAAINSYLSLNQSSKNLSYINEAPINNADIISVTISNEENVSKNLFSFDENIKLNFELKGNKFNPVSELSFAVFNKEEVRIFTTTQQIGELNSENGEMQVQAIIPKLFLVPGFYTIIVALHIPNVEVIRQIDSVLGFEIEETGSEFYKYSGSNIGVIFSKVLWKQNSIIE